MSNELFEDVIIEYIYFDNCDIICTSFGSDLTDGDELPEDE